MKLFDQNLDLSETTKLKQQIIHHVTTKAENILKFDQEIGVLSSNFLLKNGRFSEHHNQFFRKELIKMAKVNFEIGPSAVTYRLERKISKFCEKLADGNYKILQFDNSESKLLFHYLENGVYSSQNLYNPCLSPFLNDCDPVNSFCEGVMHNKFQDARLDNNPSSPKLNLNLFYSCTCKEGY